MDEYSIQPELSSFLRPIGEIIDGIAKQAIYHPYQAAFSSAVTVVAAAKGFGMPDSCCVGLGVVAFVFIVRGLRRDES